MPKCEFCCKEVDAVASTVFFCNYCRPCLTMVLEQTRDAIREIIAERRARKLKSRGRKNSQQQTQGASG